MGPNPTKKLLHSKGNYQKVKRQPTEWEKIFVNDIFAKQLISKIYIELMQLNIKIKKKKRLYLNRSAGYVYTFARNH